jgi:hypothetical protein
MQLLILMIEMFVYENLEKISKLSIRPGRSRDPLDTLQ